MKAKRILACLLSLTLCFGSVTLPARAETADAEAVETTEVEAAETEATEAEALEADVSEAAEADADVPADEEPVLEPDPVVVSEPALLVEEEGDDTDYQCGDDLVWSFDETRGTLSITGSGGMYDYYEGGTPWAEYADKIVIVSIWDNVTRIGDYAFAGFTNLQGVSMCDTVTEIGYGAFMNCTGMTGVDLHLSTSLTQIDDEAFAYCTSLQNVELPGDADSFNGIEIIGPRAFQGCSSLESVSVPLSVKEIGEGAFAECPNLTIQYAGSMEHWASVGPDDEDWYALNVHFAIALSGDCGNDVHWELQDNGVLMIYGSGDMSDAENKEDRYWDPYRRYIHSAVIGEGVTNIGAYTFSDCSYLTNIIIAESVSQIGASAFSGCSRLQQVDVPEAVTSIGIFAFEESGVVDVTGMEGVRSIGDYAFSSCYQLALTTLPDSVRSLGGHVFENCYALTEFTLPSRLTIIPEYTFSNSSLQKITIPATVKTIGIRAFYYNAALTEVMFAEGSQLSKIEEYAFENCSALKTFDVSANTQLTTIEGGAFSYCIELDNIQLPDTVTSLGWNAFEGDTALEAIVLPEGLTSLSGSLFQNCGALTSVSIPDTVTTIEGNAFNECDSLQTIDLPANLQQIDTYAFGDCDNLRTITMPESLTYLGDGAFYNCRKLSSVTLNDALATMDGNVFNSCTSLTSIVLPKSLSRIEYDAFYGCTALRSVTFSDSITYIGERAFYNCSRLGEIVLGDGVQEIGTDAFYFCTDLAEITLPLNLHEIRSYAFNGCTGLTDVYYPGAEDAWNLVNVAEENDYLNEAEFHFGDLLAAGRCGDDLTFELKTDGILRITGTGAMWDRGEQSSYWDDNDEWVYFWYEGDYGTFWSRFADRVTEVVFPEGLTSIGGNAFGVCTALTEISIPAGLERIGQEAFVNCTALTDLYFDGSEQDWGLLWVASERPEYGLSKDVNYHFTETASGTCGEDLTWTLDHDGTLTISGTGPMYYDENREYDGYYAQGYDWNSDGFAQFIKKVVLEEGVTTVGYEAFCYNMNLEEVEFPSTLEKIHPYAFRATGLINVEIPDGVTEIESCAFRDCTQLESVTLPGGITQLYDECFYGCTALTEITLPASLNTIGYSAFHNCTSLAAVTLEGNPGNIYWDPFEGCDALTDVYYSGTEHSWHHLTDGNTGKLIDATVHFGETDYYAHYVEAKEATCTEEGNIAYWSCWGGPTGTEEYFADAQCTVTLTYEETRIPATGEHTWGEWITDGEATCMMDGSKHRECTICGECESESISMVDHEIVTEVIAPTCTEQGYTHTYCKYGCGMVDEYTDYTDALGHVWGDLIVDSEPSCTASGIGHYVCAVCGEIWYDVYIDPIEHDWGEWITDGEATCMMDGSKHRECTVCGETEWESIPAVDHEIVTEVVAPTCTEQGYTHSYCKYGCGMVDEYTDYTDALGHDWDEGTVLTEVTCGNSGVIEYHCTRCDECWQEEIMPTDQHSWGELIVESEPSCTTMGSGHYECTVCGQIWYDVIIDPIDHDIVSEVVAPTCTEQGYTHHYCSYGCGTQDDYTDYTDALGHDWDDGEVTTEPTTAEEGVRTYTCSRCGGTKTESIPKILTGWQKIDGKWYWYDSNNTPVIGWKKISGTYYYFNTDGVMQTKWQKIGGKWYYLGTGGKMVTGWQIIGGKTYYFNASGDMVVGWKKLSGVYYYFNASGVMQTGWQKISNVYYYFNTNGQMQTGWQTISGTKYFFKGSGAMATGWQKINGYYYYFKNSGAMVKGWYKVGSKWYYFHTTSGVMQTGWLKLSGKWYYLNTGGDMVIGWKQIGGKWYWFDNGGVMYANGTITISGKNYTFDKNGAMQ